MPDRFIVHGKPARLDADTVLQPGEEIDVSGWRWQTVERYVTNGHLIRIPEAPDREAANAPPRAGAAKSTKSPARAGARS